MNDSKDDIGFILTLAFPSFLCHKIMENTFRQTFNFKSMQKVILMTCIAIYCRPAWLSVQNTKTTFELVFVLFKNNYKKYSATNVLPLLCVIALLILEAL
jgi:hypothetical protein